MARPDCTRCDGTGFVVDEARGVAAAARCRCETPEPAERDLRAHGVPRRYLECTFDNYITHLRSETEGNLREALARCRTFVDRWPDVSKGLMLTGRCGVGKTHLAVAILRGLVLEKGCSGLFVDYETLLKRIQSTWSRREDGLTESAVLEPVLEAEALVLDDLGSRRSTAWVEETVGHVLSTRYNEARTTIVTTNLLDGDAPDLMRDEDRWSSEWLAHRVPERVLSRLHEMCAVLDVKGDDYRRRTNRFEPRTR